MTNVPCLELLTSKSSVIFLQCCCFPLRTRQLDSRKNFYTNITHKNLMQPHSSIAYIAGYHDQYCNIAIDSLFHCKPREIVGLQSDEVMPHRDVENAWKRKFSLFGTSARKKNGLWHVVICSFSHYLKRDVGMEMRDHGNSN